MHKSDAQRSESQRVITQAEADSCCASAEGGDSTPSATPFAGLLAPALLPSPLPAVALPVRVQIHAWRALIPTPPEHVPKHVFLSVFLV
jgi:hypothetical protein